MRPKKLKRSLHIRQSKVMIIGNSEDIAKFMETSIASTLDGPDTKVPKSQAWQDAEL